MSTLALQATAVAVIVVAIVTGRAAGRPGHHRAALGACCVLALFTAAALVALLAYRGTR